jgi:hypothetical protein
MRVLVLLTLLSVVAAAVGCGSDDGGSKVNEDVAAMMKKMPRGSDMFACFDVRAMHTDNDLAPVSEALIGGWDEVFETLGMPVDDMDAVAMSGEDTLVFEGRFDLDEIRDVLDDGGFDEDEYLDVEVWETGETGVALVSDDCIIFQTDGDIEDCIDAMEGKRASLYDDEDITDSVGRLPDGLFILYGPEGQEPFGDFGFDDLEATAASIGKRDADTLWMVVVFRFEDEDAADDALEEIEDGLTSNTEGVDPDTIKIKQDRRYVEVTAEAAMDTFLS